MSDRCQIVATGSNAYVFSSELGTRLSGRYIEIPVYSLTYAEFLEFHGMEDSDGSLMAYLRVGGLPALCRFDISDESQVRDYLQGVFNTVMMKDVILRNDIRNIEFAQNLAVFVADNAGKLISTASIFKFMKSQGTKISEAVVGSYLKHLCNAMLTVYIPRYDIHGKKIFEQIYKYYFSDHGIRNFLSGFNIRNSIEKIMENVVLHHLLVQGFKVSVGILRAGEIDFVAERGNKVLYIQVAYLVADEATQKREFGSLLRIKDNYPKYVISMDPVTDGFNAYEGIHHLHLREFLKTTFSELGLESAHE